MIFQGYETKYQLGEAVMYGNDVYVVIGVSIEGVNPTYLIRSLVSGTRAAVTDGMIEPTP